MYYVGKYLYKGTVKYINWNLKIIKGRWQIYEFW
jgi:uncharacterized membrane protein